LLVVREEQALSFVILRNEVAKNLVLNSLKKVKDEILRQESKVLLAFCSG